MAKERPQFSQLIKFNSTFEVPKSVLSLKEHNFISSSNQKKGWAKQS